MTTSNSIDNIHAKNSACVMDKYKFVKKRKEIKIMTDYENTNLTTTENTEVNESYNEVNYSDEGSNGGLLGIVIAGGVGLVAGGIAAWKNKDTLTGWVKQKQITKCEKKAAKLGYTLCVAVDEFDEEIEDTVDDESAEDKTAEDKE